MKSYEIYSDKDLTPLTTFGIPARSRFFAEFSSLKELKLIFRSPEFRDNEVFVMGGGSNLLFLNDFDGFVLRNAMTSITRYDKDDVTAFVIADGGVKWSDLVDWCVDRGLAGLENLAGIPGDAGASAVQNIGAYGVEAGDRIHSVECFDIYSGEIKTFKRDECYFSYRSSIFKEELKDKYIVLRVSFKLDVDGMPSSLNYGPLKNLEEELGHFPSISEVRDAVLNIRNAKLPSPEKLGSAGSFFKNPVVSREYYEKVLKHKYPDMPCYDAGKDKVKVSAAWMIDKCGLKGKRIGGAEVYDRQCLVIVNAANAASGDVVSLADEIIMSVRNRFGVTLKPEVNYIDSGMKVTILGSGTSKGVPEVGCNCEVCRSTDEKDKRLRSSVLVETHGQRILIDVTPDFRTQALRKGIADLDALLITHTHYDHVGGMDDLRVFTASSPLPVYMKKDVADNLYRHLDYCFSQDAYPGVASFDVKLIDSSPFRIGSTDIIPLQVHHGRMPVLGFRIGNFAYITDASEIPEDTLSMLGDLDVLVINALRKTPHFAHFDLQQALDIIAEVNPCRAYLTHICHEMGRAAEVEKELPDNVHLAYDGLEIYVKSVIDD